jgi:tricorn protease interacting factor F2/3
MTPDAPLAVGDYRLALDVDFAALRWAGTVELLPVPGEGRTVLDAESLTVRAVRRDGTPVPFRHDPVAHRLTIDHGAAAGGPISVDFDGAANLKALVGLYRSRHGSGYVLTTQCEPTGARQIFPCIDRPDRKGRLWLTVRTAAGLDVVSNGPGSARELPDGRREWTFEPPPPMATYLFYLGIGRFERGAERPGRVAIRVLTPPGRGPSGAYAGEAAERILRACEEYYGLPYPLPKLDLLAIEEHAFGAMENWGAISFQALRLLVDAESASFSRRDVFETISHEVSHQWFGNLVTMAWWDDVWLNESFAALMETKITEQLEPGLDPRADYFLRVAGMQAAIEGDSLRSTHPVRAPVDRPEEISQIFDEISYGKGASVLQMLEAYLGEDRFRRGVGEYLRRFRNGNARTADLWAALERASGEPVAEIASPWIDRAGMPSIAASLSPQGLELSQRRFGYLPPPPADPWPIPIVLDIDGRRERRLLRSAKEIVPVPSGAVVHLNPGATGFYRVLYDRTLSDRLLEALPGRPAADRWIVLEDLAAFLQSGEVDWATYARFVDRLGATTDRLVVEALAQTLTGLALAMPRAERLQELARRFLAGALERIGPERRPDEPGTFGVLRDRLAFARVRVDLPFAGALADRFSRWSTLDPDLQAAVAIARARTGGAEGFREIRASLGRSPSEIQALRLGHALVWTSQPELVREALDFALGGGVSRTRLVGVVTHAAANPAAWPVAWPWLTEHLPALDEIYRGSGYLPLIFERALPALGNHRLPELRAFFAAHPYPEGERGLAKALERLEVYEGLERRIASAVA